MRFDDEQELTEHRFAGFISVTELQKSKCSEVPNTKGVYLIICSETTPQFLVKSSGGFFKGKSPAVTIAELRANWVHSAKVIYIGKAGKLTGNGSLKSRLRQYMDFGQGKPVGHWGGRFVWQLVNSGALKVCWKVIEGSPRELERQMIQDFAKLYNKRPFANLRN